jgi:glycosyltransferase involved in cell wall biosynthesis
VQAEHTGVRRPRVVILRGHGVTPWELAPWELLADRFEVVCLVTGRNRFEVGSLPLAVQRVWTVRDLLPPGRLGDLAVLGPGDRYLRLSQHLRGADVVHSLELGNPWSGQPAALKRELGFKLVLTAWETIPLLGTWRFRRGRTYRARAIAETDVFLATSERARDCLVLEGVHAARIEICPPGIDVDRFTGGWDADGPVVSIGRLVWEKGHQDVLRALAALRRGVVPGVAPRLSIVGTGPDGPRLRRYADELGVGDLVEFTSASYDTMPDVFRRASRLVLASLATPVWEEQFGMVLAEALAAGVPIVTTTSGAIPLVVGGAAELVAPGDWMALARALARPPARALPGELARTYSLQAAAERLAGAYERVLGG